MERISQKSQFVYGNEIIHNIWYLPVSAAHLYQYDDVKDTILNDGYGVNLGNGSKTGTF